MDTISQSTVGKRRADQVPLTPGQQMRAYSDDGAVVIDVAVQAVGHCHTCGTSVPFGIGEVHGSAQKYVDGPYKDGLLAAWAGPTGTWPPAPRPAGTLRRPATGPMTNCEAYRNLPPRRPRRSPIWLPRSSTCSRPSPRCRRPTGPATWPATPATAPDTTDEQ
ncbi:putative protein OS=Streptomyces rimosus subsp. rimosus (strain ATCC / DSM 40260 / JCM 4667 / NRRL 2234) OX=1265868 GN=SRIM_017365 PE=4 SV=1 [Streptomyces rimosus subsp. rimosus]